MVSNSNVDAVGDVKRAFAQYWDQRAPSFDTQPQHVSQSEEEAAAWRVALLKLTGDRKRLRVLDVGAGTGFLAILLAEMGHQVTGIDLSLGMMEQGRLKVSQLGYDIPFLEMDAEQTTFPDATFDLVASRHLIWNLPNPVRAIAEWTRITRPGGVVSAINGTFKLNQQRYEEPYLAAFQQLPMPEGLTPDAIADWMKQSGLTQIRVEWLEELTELKRRTLPANQSNPQNHRYMVLGVKPKA